jgi:hypothetical protein
LGCWGRFASSKIGAVATFVLPPAQPLLLVAAEGLPGDGL